MATNPLYGPPKVGGDTLSYCTKCKIELAHVVVSMMDGKPAKVQCKTCKGTHKYKLGAPAPRTRSTGKSKEERVSVRAADYWETKMSENSGKTPKPYSPKESFQKGDVMQHSSFGMGLVEECRLNNKLLVLFRVGEKLLIHNMK